LRCPELCIGIATPESENSGKRYGSYSYVHVGACAKLLIIVVSIFRVQFDICFEVGFLHHFVFSRVRVTRPSIECSEEPKMKYRFLFFFLAAFCFSSSFSISAQRTPSSDGGRAMSTDSPSLDAMGIKSYLLGPGDELELKLFQQPDLNTVLSVDSDGNIVVPFIESPIRAVCRTDKDVAADVKTAYEKLFQNPQISLRVTGRYSRPPVAVYGAVRDPQRIQALRKARLNEIISFAGGTTERSNGSIQIVHTEKLLCPEPGEALEPQKAVDAVTPPLNVYKIADIIAGKPEANPFVRPGDVVTVLEAEPVYVTGSVVNPQGLYLKAGMTLGRALAMVGGPTRGAKASEITIYRQDLKTGSQKRIPVNYSAIKKQQQPDIELQPYDIIDVPIAGPFAKENLLNTFGQGVLGAMGSVMTAPAQALPLRILY
jgi:polysaccharide export outer membrane protein